MDAAGGFESGVDGIAEKIDKELLELVGIGLDFDFWARLELDGKAALESCDAANPDADIHGLQNGRGKFREARVGAHETREPVCARGDDVEAAAHVLLPVGSALFPAEHAAEIFGDGLDGSERIIQLVTEDADEALPGLALFFAEGAAQVRDDEKLVRQAAFAKAAAMNFPATGFSGESDLGNARRFATEAIGEAEFVGGAAEQFIHGDIEKTFAGTIDEAELAGAIEGENGNVNFFHDFAEKSGGLQRAEPLLAKGFAKRVDFAEDFAEHVVAICAAGANGEITFTKCGEKIRERAHGKDDAILRGESEAEPGQDH